MKSAYDAALCPVERDDARAANSLVEEAALDDPPDPSRSTSETAELRKPIGEVHPPIERGAPRRPASAAEPAPCAAIPRSVVLPLSVVN